MNKKNIRTTCLFACSIVQILFLTSCDKDIEPQTRLLFASGTEYTSSSDTVNVQPGQIVTSSLYGEAGGNATLKRFRIQYTYNSKDIFTFLDSTLTGKEFGIVFSFSPRSVTGFEKWIFTLEDTDNKIQERSYTLKTTATNPAFNSYSSVFFYQSPLRNLRYFNPDNGTVYPGYFIRNAANKPISDKIAFYLDKSTLNDTLINIVGFNNTTFKSTSLENLSTINSVENIKAAYSNASGAEVTNINNVGASRVIAFKTKAGKTGVLGNFIFDKNTSNETATPRKYLRQVKYEVRAEKTE